MQLNVAPSFIMNFASYWERDQENIDERVKISILEYTLEEAQALRAISITKCNLTTGSKDRCNDAYAKQPSHFQNIYLAALECKRARHRGHANPDYIRARRDLRRAIQFYTFYLVRNLKSLSQIPDFADFCNLLANSKDASAIFRSKHLLLSHKESSLKSWSRVKLLRKHQTLRKMVRDRSGAAISVKGRMGKIIHQPASSSPSRTAPASGSG